VADAFGTRRVEFDLPVNTLNLPLRGADPALADIRRRHAAALPSPESVTWYAQFRMLLADMITEGPRLRTGHASRRI
jgi:hypothetical protein